VGLRGFDDDSFDPLILISIRMQEMEEKEKDLDQTSETKKVEAAERAEKIEGQANKLMEEKQIQSADSIDVLYYAGCTASYDINVKEVGSTPSISRCHRHQVWDLGDRREVLRKSLSSDRRLRV